VYSGSGVIALSLAAASLAAIPAIWLAIRPVPRVVLSPAD
jgi:hypothetical protein